MGASLRPCPFCGGEPIAYNYDPYRGEIGGVEHVAVLCTGCGARIIKPTHEDAVARWNRRVMEKCIVTRKPKEKK